MNYILLADYEGNRHVCTMDDTVTVIRNDRGGYRVIIDGSSKEYKEVIITDDVDMVNSWLSGV